MEISRIIGRPSLVNPVDFLVIGLSSLAFFFMLHIFAEALGRWRDGRTSDSTTSNS